MIFELERELKPKIDEEIIREYLAAFNEFKFPGPDKLHPRLLRECADVITEPVLVTFEKLWQWQEVRDAKGQANVPVFLVEGAWWCFRVQDVDSGNYRLVSMALVFGKSIACPIKQMIFKALERAEITRRKHDLTKSKSCLTKLISFFEWVSRMVDERNTVA